ncbi:hypothetical protein X970_11120 [Pseudomonas monteilii SB3101]|uniref:Uncharacterized protein n=2 Tax=Pseudomonas monteilii TaxID=76759 RepID=A0A7X3F132_9PSED|nr:hypothetical protein [Pseudomonas monteilii]AHC85735.1 hypothetical protein X969_11465 [Pseudomonas monteilii SB3078]AHC91095.1 hypothetical protein X970_11120 [Pseudomonas monteilii SB3101]MVF49396.1 hypothetical protein [Pseudomonas monteilii]
MKQLKKMAVAFCNRKKYTYAELSDWKLLLIGIPSFAVGAYYLWVSGNVTVEMLNWSQDHAITLDAMLAFAFLGLIGLSGLYFATVARRCYELIYERNFK